MRFEEFELERNQSLYENEVDYNLSESGVHPLKISEILTKDEQTQILDKELLYGYTNGTPQLRKRVIDIYDKDETCHKITAQYINQFDYDFKIVQYGDYFERTELRRRHLVINTACEHMNDLKDSRKYYKGTPTMILQSNNYIQQEDHINCCENVEELIYKNGLAYINYSGSKKFDLYDRFMVIGAWLN